MMDVVKNITINKLTQPGVPEGKGDQAQPGRQGDCKGIQIDIQVKPVAQDQANYHTGHARLQHQGTDQARLQRKPADQQPHGKGYQY